jgi:orotate phosphoribosyltransferase
LRKLKDALLSRQPIDLRRNIETEILMSHKEQALGVLKMLGVVWQYPDTAESPHALLTSGKHSNLFCNLSKLLEEPGVLSDMCAGLLRQTPILKKVRFVGSAMGGVAIAHEFGRLTGNRAAFTEKSGDEMRFARFTLEKGETVVIVEDVLTTGGTTLKTIAACIAAGAEIYPVIYTMVNRSGGDVLMGADDTCYGVLSAVSIRGSDWEPESCPLCAEGSKALRPKANWSLFFPESKA